MASIKPIVMSRDSHSLIGYMLSSLSGQGLSPGFTWNSAYQTSLGSTYKAWLTNVTSMGGEPEMVSVKIGIHQRNMIVAMLTHCYFTATGLDKEDYYDLKSQIMSIVVPLPIYEIDRSREEKIDRME